MLKKTKVGSRPYEKATHGSPTGLFDLGIKFTNIYRIVNPRLGLTIVKRNDLAVEFGNSPVPHPDVILVDFNHPTFMNRMMEFKGMVKLDRSDEFSRRPGWHLLVSFAHRE
jgi:hypothetical protein